MVSIIFKGLHASFPPYFKRVKKEMKYEITFNESCVYDHGDIDQFDWNKLIGIKKHFFSPRKNSFMIGWRWNTTRDRLELTPYYHDEAGKAHYNDRGIFYISKEEFNNPVTVSFHMDASGTFNYSIRSINYSYLNELQLDGLGQKWWLIKNWFGGQKTAPHKVTIDFKKK